MCEATISNKSFEDRLIVAVRALYALKVFTMQTLCCQGRLVKISSYPDGLDEIASCDWPMQIPRSHPSRPGDSNQEQPIPELVQPKLALAGKRCLAIVPAGKVFPQVSVPSSNPRKSEPSTWSYVSVEGDSFGKFLS